MTESELPLTVRAFVHQYVDSIPELEALLLTAAEPGVAWLEEPLARRLYIEVRLASHVLETLERRGFLAKRESGYHFAPRSPELDAAVRSLMDAYRRFLIPITSIVHSKTRPAFRDFSDAFRLREDK
jgi:hypothetical protein